MISKNKLADMVSFEMDDDTLGTKSFSGPVNLESSALELHINIFLRRVMRFPQK